LRALLLRSLLLPALISFAAAQDARAPLTVERIFGHGSVAGEPPSAITWSPDGKHLTYIDGGELMDLDPASGKPRMLVSRTKVAAIAGGDEPERYALTRYKWSPDSKHLLFDANGRIWLYDLGTGTGVQIGSSDAELSDDPKFSPNGQWITFVRKHGLSIIRTGEFNNPEPYSIAPAQNNGAMTSGEVDWVYREELDVQSNYSWSPESNRIAFLQMNESAVPEYPIVDWMRGHASVENQRYPQAGDTNPDVRLGVVGTSGGRVNWVRLPMQAGQDYVPRFGWVDHRVLWFETLSRDHKHRRISFADPAAGQVRQMLDISDDKYLNEQYDVFVDDGAIVTTSWSDGHNHIYLYRYNAPNPLSTTDLKPEQLTRGDFDVSGIGHVDARRGLVEYASNEGNPLEQQLWQVDFKGGRKPLTSEAGFHEGNFNPDGTHFIETFSTRMSPPRLSVCAVDGSCHEFWRSHGADDLHLHEPEVLQAKTRDGTTLYATLMLPEGKSATGSVPLIVNPYGGPGPQTVVNRWGEHFWGDDLPFDALLAEHGFAVLRADNRGMGARGRDFAQAAYRNFGAVQLEDQLTVLDAALAKYPQLDKDRLGWWGWSWGGHFTLYAMTHSDRFKAGVSVAPVTDWRDYDSIYTERYLGLPGGEPETYRIYSAVSSAAQLKGKLLLVHGTGDDNVHFENSVQFIQRLIAAGLPYDLQIFPRKRHDIDGADARLQLFKRILAHFEENLGGNANR
jgi:dipeptidyl-peptidase-4